jgi:malate synthase
MAAFIPSRRDPAVNEVAMAKVGDDKRRESADGFDGTWLAHPDLVPLATEIFTQVLGLQPNQKERRREDVNVTAADLLNLHVDGGRVTEAGVRSNISVALQYLDAWLGGNGAAAINNLMEDAATAEISRSQLWQWRTIRVRLDDGSIFDAQRYREFRDQEVARLGDGAYGHLAAAATLLDGLVLSDTFAEFLTLGAYPLLG